MESSIQTDSQLSFEFCITWRAGIAAVAAVALTEGDGAAGVTTTIAPTLSSCCGAYGC